MQLLNKDGALLSQRRVYRTHLIQLYRIYTFYVEVITELGRDQVININPVLTKGVLNLYRGEEPQGNESY